MESSPEITGMYQKNRILLTDQDDHRCWDCRINLMFARRTLLHDRRSLYGRSTTYRAETAMAIPIKQLKSLTRLLVTRSRDIIPRGTQPHMYVTVIPLHRSIQFCRTREVHPGNQPPAYEKPELGDSRHKGWYTYHSLSEATVGLYKKRNQ